MKWFLTKVKVLLASALLWSSATAATPSLAPAVPSPALPDTVSVDTIFLPVDTIVLSPYVRRTMRIRRDWSRLTPNMQTLQFAGSIGMLSVGMGWHYGRRDQLETELLFGYLPHCNGSEHHYTLTLKQRYIPWHVPLSKRSERWVLEPLTCGGFINTIFGEGFWRREPSKYTKGYYGFNTKLRYNLFVGQRLKFNIPKRHRRFNKSISAYYELSTCDLYVVSSVPNRRIKFHDIVSLAFGMKFEIF